MSVPPYQTVLERFPKHAKAIGIATVEMANLDIFISYLFSVVLKVPIAVGSSIFLIPISSTARLQMLETAIDGMLEDNSVGKKTLLALHKRARKITTDRDAMIHNSWGTNASGQVATRGTRALTPMTPVPLEQLERMILDIRLLIGDLRTQTSKLERDLSRAK